ncbi:hypothetical protein P9112_002119 [Eukaryota sp. TZLM1-RC]
MVTDLMIEDLLLLLQNDFAIGQSVVETVHLVGYIISAERFGCTWEFLLHDDSGSIQCSCVYLEKDLASSILEGVVHVYGKPYLRHSLRFEVVEIDFSSSVVDEAVHWCHSAKNSLHLFENRRRFR